MAIRFGTSGWRAVIAEEFTFARLALVVQAIANTLKQDGAVKRGVVVGYDTRFLSDAFAKEAAEVLASNGIPVLLSRRDVPTPCVAFTILRRKTLGGINLSASHNPPEYGGIKFSSSYGGPAGIEITRRIEEEIQKLLRKKHPFNGSQHSKQIHDIDPAPPYLKHLAFLIDLKTLKRANLRLIVDCLNGTSRDYLDRFLKPVTAELTVLRNTLDPTFGGKRPDPVGENLSGLIREVRRRRADLGLATDGDADRFGIVDRNGLFIPPNDVISLLLEYLIETRPRAPLVARTLATTHRVDAIASAHGLEVEETPVGFKYIGEILSGGKCLLGAEESAGLSIQHHVPEKDGILACLLVAEMVASRRKSLREMMRSLNRKYGPFYSLRRDLALSPESKKRFLSHLAKEKIRRFGPFPVLRQGRMDGFKFYLEKENWILLRPSGTEPLIRLYIEGRSQKHVAELKRASERLIRRLSSS